MGQASLATFYVVFAIFTIYLNLESIGTWDANAIYRTISKAISENPFSLENLNTTRFLDEVQDPEQVYDWMRDAFRPVLFGEQEDMSVHASWQNMSSWTHNKTPPTIGSFNRILLVRFTFKRWAVQPTIGQFQPSTPYRLAGGVSRLDAFSQNAAEDKTHALRSWDWQLGGSSRSWLFPVGNRKQFRSSWRLYLFLRSHVGKRCL